MGDLRRKQRRALIVALLAIGVLFLTLGVAVVLATPASGALRSDVGRALTRPGLSLALQGERSVFIWANYWACRALPGAPPSWIHASNTVGLIQLDGGYLLCGWVASGWRIFPASWRCHMEPLADSTYLVSVCGPPGLTPALGRAGHVARADVTVAPGH